VHRAIDPGPSYDVFWIFALWRALHGGDPRLADVAAAVIAVLSEFLPGCNDSFGVAPLPPSPEIAATNIEAGDPGDLDEFDVPPMHGQPPDALGLFCYDPREFSIHHYYFKAQGVFFRLDRPAFACLPTAA